jgi:predicted small secreted protein
MASEMHHIPKLYDVFRRDINPKQEVTFMDRHFFGKVFSALILACSLATILGSFACNTVHGLGEDIERGGEKTQDAADRVKRRL